MANYKAPPLLSKCEWYKDWLLEIDIWQGFTKEDETIQGPEIFLSLEGKARQAVRNIAPAPSKSKNGVKEIIKVLDKLYKRKVQLGFGTYDTFEWFLWPADMSISDYINGFEFLLNKTMKFGTTMLANLSEEQEQIVIVIIDKYMFETLRNLWRKKDA